VNIHSADTPTRAAWSPGTMSRLVVALATLAT